MGVQDYHLVYWKKKTRSNLWKTNLWTGPSDEMQLQKEEDEWEERHKDDDRQRRTSAESAEHATNNALHVTGLGLFGD